MKKYYLAALLFFSFEKICFQIKWEIYDQIKTEIKQGILNSKNKDVIFHKSEKLQLLLLRFCLNTNPGSRQQLKKKWSLGKSTHDDILWCKEELMRIIALKTEIFGDDDISKFRKRPLERSIINYLEKDEIIKFMESISSNSEDNRNLSTDLINLFTKIRHRTDPNPIPLD